MAGMGVAHHGNPLPPGTVGPDFELPSTPDQKVMLSEFRGRLVAGTAETLLFDKLLQLTDGRARRR